MSYCLLLITGYLLLDWLPHIDKKRIPYYAYRISNFMLYLWSIEIEYSNAYHHIPLP